MMPMMTLEEERDHDARDHQRSTQRESHALLARLWGRHGASSRSNASQMAGCYCAVTARSRAVPRGPVTAFRCRHRPGTECRMSANGNADARAAGLRYSSDEEPGISRRKAGRGFTYRTARGGDVAGERQLARIRALGDSARVDERVDLRRRARAPAGDGTRRPRAQAVPLPPRLAHAPRRDEVRPHAGVRHDAAARARADRERPGPPRPAARARARGGRPSRRRDPDPRRQRAVPARERVVRRDDDARAARAGGRPAHHVEFKGKSGKLHQAEVTDRRLARTLQKLHDLPGRELFEYLDETASGGRVHSDDVNLYLREISGARDRRSRTSARGARARSACGRSRISMLPPSPKSCASARSRRRSARSRRRSATRPPCAAPPTCTPRILESLRRRRAPACVVAPLERARPLGVGPAQVPALAFMTRRRPPDRWRTTDRRSDGTSGSTGGLPRPARRATRARP